MVNRDSSLNSESQSKDNLRNRLKMNDQNLAKLQALNNAHVLEIVEKYVDLCKPSKVTVITDAEEDIAYARQLALRSKEETPLAIDGHTVHFDGPRDQARDRVNTKILLREGQKISERLNTGDRETCLQEIFSLLDGAMAGKEMLVLFLCLGPVNSRFSIPALQITDSAYVAHSETILYRSGYEEFKRLQGSLEFFHFVHSAGELENGVSKNIDKRRMYIDLEGNRVLSLNNQYAGNSVGLKKLALRLAIQKAHKEGWLTEHMFIVGATPANKDRVTYFTGAFPSACGKTSTTMIPGQTIVGDDIAYIRSDQEGRVRAVNAEQGVFGILEDVNPVDDPLLYEEITTPGEMIFSNILVNDAKAHWLGMGPNLPNEGTNYAGRWRQGDKDEAGDEIKLAHKNARITVRLEEFENVDSKLHDPHGLPISGFIYGGRDSDTNPPVLQAFDWSHGIFLGASLESETTAATIGKIGVRNHDAMAIMDFLVIPLGTYLENLLRFGESLEEQPKVFRVNYFLKKDGAFLNQKVDKKVWLMWMEGRVHGEYEAILTPAGWIPRFGDLQALFKQVFEREYSKVDYEEQFAVRILGQLEKLDRIETIYRKEADVPEAFYLQIEQQRERLATAREKYGQETINPSAFE